MRAARSDSLRIVSRPRCVFSSSSTLREPLGPRQDRRERIVQLVRDAGNRLAERGQLLGLQQLVIHVARLILEFLALADVPNQRLARAGRPLRARHVRRLRHIGAGRAHRSPRKSATRLQSWQAGR